MWSGPYCELYCHAVWTWKLWNLPWRDFKSFICPRAHHYGGFYERLVKLLKTPLKKTLGKAMLTEGEMRTTLSVVEAQINSCPLTHCSDDTSDPLPLTPAEIIVDWPLSDDRLSRLRWEHGRIKEIFKGRDGLLRSALEKMSQGVFRRPFTVLRTLEAVDTLKAVKH